MNIVNSIIKLGSGNEPRTITIDNEPCVITIDHDQETGDANAKLQYMNADIIDITWGIKKRKDTKFRLGATAHGLTQLYLYVHHNLIKTDSPLVRDYFTWRREEILENIKTLGIIYNGDEWWDKLKQSFFRLAIVEQKSETLKAVMVLTSDAKEHKAFYTISADSKLTDRENSGRTQLLGVSTRIVSYYNLTESPESIDSILAKYTPEHVTAKAV